jgi:hypothetical protein
MADSTEVAVIQQVVAKDRIDKVKDIIQIGGELQKLAFGSKKNGQPVSLIDGAWRIAHIMDDEPKKKKKKKRDNSYGLDISLYSTKGKKKKKKKNKKKKKAYTRYEF